MTISDDVAVGADVQKLFDLNFTPTSYVISIRVGNSELETNVFKINLVEPKKIALLTELNNATPIFLAIDQSLYNFEPPAIGTVVTFSVGVNPLLPGWFVGTQIDLDTGTVSSPFTGSAVVQSHLEVSSVPEPATLLLLGSGIAGVAIRLRKRKMR